MPEVRPKFWSDPDCSSHFVADRVQTFRPAHVVSVLNAFSQMHLIKAHSDVSTVLLAKSDSDVMLCLQSYQGLIIDRSHVIYQFALALLECTR